MKLSKIRIRNIMGVEDMEIAPNGASLKITGVNGSGKTSILEAVRSVVGKGHDATLLRSNCDKGESVLVFDDGTELRETITPTKTTRKLTHPLYGKQDAKADYLAKLLTGTAANPVALLTAKDADVTTTLLTAMPLKITSEEVATLTGQPGHVESYRFPCAERHALVVLSDVEKANFEARTAVNRSLKEKTGTIEQLTATLPKAPDACDDWAGRVTELTTELEQLAGDKAKALADAESGIELRQQEETASLEHDTRAIETEIRERDTAITTTLEKSIAQLRAAASVKQQALQTEQAERIAARTARHTDTAAALATEAENARAEVDITYNPQLSQLDQDLGHARAMAEMETGAKKQREIIATMEQERDAQQAEADRLTGIIDAIRSAKVRLTKDLPLAGVEIVEGVVHVDGVPWSRVNEARRIRLAVDMVTLQSGEWKACICDGIEALDSTTFRQLDAALEAAGIQGILAGVNDGPLTVQTGAA